MNPRIAWTLLRGMPRAGTHADRLTRFYAPQATGYDATRERLLPGRRDLMADLAERLPVGAIVVDLGGGTGAHLDHLGEGHGRIQRLHLVDLCPPLLAQAHERGRRQGWDHLVLHEADATTWRPPEPVDAVICSFSLTMIPAWRQAVEGAVAMLRPGGLLAVVDFTVPAAQPEPGLTPRPAWMRRFWPWWFAHDGVHLAAEHLPCLRSQVEQITLHEGLHRLPWMPLAVPYYRFLGRSTRGGSMVIP